MMMRMLLLSSLAPAVIALVLALGILRISNEQVIAQDNKIPPHINSSPMIVSKTDERRVMAAAAQFTKRFYQTLDFEVVFKEMFVSNAIKLKRSARFFSNLNLSEDLVSSLDDEKLKITYVSAMDAMYLKAIYELSVSDDTPNEILEIIRTSSFNNILSDDGSGETTILRTVSELDQFNDEVQRIAALYRSGIPKDFAKTLKYREGLSAIGKNQTSRVSAINGLEWVGVAKGTKIFTTEKDLFIFYFIEERGKLKVLALGLGD